MAACGACAEIAKRHLRVGTMASWDTAQEPLCHFLFYDWIIREQKF